MVEKNQVYCKLNLEIVFHPPHKGKALENGTVYESKTRKFKE